MIICQKRKWFATEKSKTPMTTTVVIPQSECVVQPCSYLLLSALPNIPNLGLQKTNGSISTSYAFLSPDILIAIGTRWGSGIPT